MLFLCVRRYIFGPCWLFLKHDQNASKDTGCVCTVYLFLPAFYHFFHHITIFQTYYIPLTVKAGNDKSTIVEFANSVVDEVAPKNTKKIRTLQCIPKMS